MQSGMGAIITKKIPSTFYDVHADEESDEQMNICNYRLALLLKIYLILKKS